MGNRIQSEEVVETDCPKVSTQNIRYDDVTTIQVLDINLLTINRDARP